MAEDIKEARRNLIFPVTQERVFRQMVDNVLQGGERQPNFEFLLGPDHYH